MENSRAYIASRGVSAVQPLSSLQRRKGMTKMNKEVEKYIKNCKIVESGGEEISAYAKFAYKMR